MNLLKYVELLKNLCIKIYQTIYIKLSTNLVKFTDYRKLVTLF